MKKMHLYFIALVPPEDLREEVKALKEGMKVRFHAKHALKSPAHITLQMPFKRSAEDEPFIIRTLADFAVQQFSFPIILSGFDSFAPRVIFIKIKNPQPIKSLHSKLNTLLLHTLHFDKNEINSQLHPHMTIATRDLKKATFTVAWSEFQHREFIATFSAKSLCLLRHNGNHWEIYHEFPFQSDDQ